VEAVSRAGRLWLCPDCRSKEVIAVHRQPERLPGLRLLWPPAKPPLRQSLLTQPETLAIVHQEFDRGMASIAKHKHSARERVKVYHITTQTAQPVNALAEIHRLYSHIYAHLR